MRRRVAQFGGRRGFNSAVSYHVKECSRQVATTEVAAYERNTMTYILAGFDSQAELNNGPLPAPVPVTSCCHLALHRAGHVPGI